MSAATLDGVDAACLAAADAAAGYADASVEVRAALLNDIADRLDDDRDGLVALADEETHLGASRLAGEVLRTTGQLRAFAELISAASGVVVDRPSGFPELRRYVVPLGPVAVFAASNFPFAFSVAGGDTASALAAGCPVVVKAHPGHPELSRRTAAHIAEAVHAAGLPAGVFSLVEGFDSGPALVQHPAIAAVGFTGSLAGGRALFARATARPDPIPFYGELGSVNPVYVTREAAEARLPEIAAGFAGSFTLGAGQFCTKPGIVFVPDGEAFASAVADALADSDAAPMLNERILSGYQGLAARFDQHPGVRTVLAGTARSAGVTPSLYGTDLETFERDVDSLGEERFGPSALVVGYDDVRRLPGVARAIGGTLTSSVHAESSADEGLDALIAAATRQSGRLVWNGWPTGVAVSPAMTHGGPYPASTAAGTTSVGAAAIDRFRRPVTFQGFPPEMVPPSAGPA
ncbi:aldehyde dehydrogenase family protein [Microbacterium sp. X-17]|uniref:aldehyde dehydrogenase family protein n=1 Tax=Microbacterium sp. X-17 TaxID=3144404 RepID=UPI0031F5A9C8